VPKPCFLPSNHSPSYLSPLGQVIVPRPGEKIISGGRGQNGDGADDGGEGAHGWEDGGGWCVPVILLSTHWPLYCLPPGMYTVPLSPFLSAGSGPVEGGLATISRSYFWALVYGDEGG
jgi:hypothetical protein